MMYIDNVLRRMKDLKIGAFSLSFSLSLSLSLFLFVFFFLLCHVKIDTDNHIFQDIQDINKSFSRYINIGILLEKIIFVTKYNPFCSALLSMA